MRPVQAKAINYLRPDIDPNTRLYVPFNEGLGSIAKDYSQYGNHAVFTDVEWGIGVNGNAGKFNGSSSFGNCGNDPSLNITDAITIVARVKSEDVTQFYQTIVASAGPLFKTGYYIKIGNNKEILFAVGSNIDWVTWDTKTNTISSGIWYHCVCTAENNGFMKIYLNGNLISQEAIGIMTPSETATTVGKNRYGQFFNGTIDEVMIYNLGLSGAQNAANAYEVTCNA